MFRINFQFVFDVKSIFRIFLFTLVFCLLGFVSPGQSLSVRLDSITLEYLNRLPKKFPGDINAIIDHRRSISLKSRVDTSSCDYIFVEEQYDKSDSSISVTEEYFKKDIDSTYFVFEDGQILDSYFAFLDDKIKEFTHSKNIRKESYPKILTREHDRWCVPVREFRKEVREGITQVYRILTLIDRKAGTVKVTVYYPPKRVFFVTVYVGGGKC